MNNISNPIVDGFVPVTPVEIAEVQEQKSYTIKPMKSINFYKGTSFRWAGEWKPGRSYVNDEYFVDYAYYEGSLWVCVESHFSEVAPSDDNSQWQIAVRRGNTGVHVGPTKPNVENYGEITDKILWIDTSSENPVQKIYSASQVDGAISHEADVRIEADATLDAKISAETADRETAVSGLQETIGDMDEAYKAADGDLLAKINAEALARATADANLQTAITKETTDRKEDISSQDKSLRQYVDSSRQTYTITSFTAIDIWNAFHSGTMGDLIFDDAEGATTLPEAVRGGKVVLLRANSESNALYVCNVEVSMPFIDITYIDFRGHIVRFRYNPYLPPYRIVVTMHAGNLPDGGSSRQVLTKTGEGIDDVEWQTPPTVTYILPFTHEEVVEWAVASEKVGQIMDTDQAIAIDEAIKANKVVMISTEDGYYPCSAKVVGLLVYINYLDNDGNVVAISFDGQGTFDNAEVKPIGLPAGGREDQVLSKWSDANQYAWIDLPTYTHTLASFTAEDVKKAFHSGDESASDLMVSPFDIAEIDKAMQAGKVILIRANEQSNSVYVCDAINEWGLVRITYRDTASHTVSFRFNPEEAEPYIWIDRHTSSLPSGGEAGQVLTKTGEGIGDVEWQTPQGGGGGAVIYNAPQTLTDEQKSQVAKNIGQPRERLILEWKNDQAEVLQPLAYDAETGYFTVESMPSWLAEDGVSVNAVINYTNAILYGSASSKNVVIGSDAGRSTIWVKRISETQFLCHIGQTNMTAATIPSTVDVSLFYFTKTIDPAFQLLKEGETSPTIGVRKFHIRITDIAARESKYTQLWLNGNPQYTQGSGDYSKYPAAAIGHFRNSCFGTTADMEVWVDYGAEGGPIGKFVRIDSNGVYFDIQQNLGYYTNPTLYSEWGGMWGFNGLKQAYLRVTALGKRATVRITEIIE